MLRSILGHRFLVTRTIPHFSVRLSSKQSDFDPDDISKLTRKTTNLLLENAVSTDDDQPDVLGPVEKKKKPRHPKTVKEPEGPIVDLSDKSVLLFPGQGAQFVGMGKKMLNTPSVFRALYLSQWSCCFWSSSLAKPCA